MDLIEREKLIEILAEMQGRCATKAALVQNSKIWRRVKDMPTVEAEPVRQGHWIKPDDGCVRPFWERYICSECLCHSWNSAYCPSCGAKMERGERWI